MAPRKRTKAAAKPVLTRVTRATQREARVRARATVREMERLLRRAPVDGSTADFARWVANWEQAVGKRVAGDALDIIGRSAERVASQTDRLISTHAGRRAVRERLAAAVDRLIINPDGLARTPGTMTQVLRMGRGDTTGAWRALHDGARANGVSPSRVRRDLRQLLMGHDVDYRLYGVDRKTMTPIRSLRHRARRLAVSVSHDTFRDATTTTLAASGLVIAATWRRSARHYTLPSSPDRCDDLARASGVQGKPGMYLLSAWPRAPHPHCECGPGDPVLIADPATWEA